MTITTTTIITLHQRRFSADILVSPKSKSVLKRLKACKPCGRGRSLSVVPAARRPIDCSFQEMGTDQWTLSTTLTDQP
jgi:hypothetical protein